MKIKIILLFYFILLISCDDDDLTKINDDGTGGISCLVDGELLRPSGGGIYGNSRIRLDNHSDNTPFILISFTNASEKYNGFANVFLIANNVDKNNLVGQKFLLTHEDDNHSESYAVFRKNEFDNSYHTNSNYTGEITFTYFDDEKFIFSGTFWFDAINQDGEIVKVRDGRFDLGM